VATATGTDLDPVGFLNSHENEIRKLLNGAGLRPPQLRDLARSRIQELLAEIRNPCPANIVWLRRLNMTISMANEWQQKLEDLWRTKRWDTEEFLQRARILIDGTTTACSTSQHSSPPSLASAPPVQSRQS